MDILASPPFVTGAITWQEQQGQWTLTLVCKATYSLEPHISTLAAEPEGLNDRDNHWDDDLEKSLYAPTDLAPVKPSPEVLLVGSAFAPRGEPVLSVFARIVVGSLDKSIEVFGPRSFGSDGALQEGARWTQMPLRYERAAGGEGSWNPVGIDPELPDGHGRRTLPNLQSPDVTVVEPGTAIAPVGFGPISARWPVRREKLGALAAAWSDERWTEIPLGFDFDGSFFQSAPRDQLIEEIRPDEPIVLENLHPGHARLVTRLPGIRPRARVQVGGLPPWELILTADTLWIDTNRAICTLTWRGQLPLDGRDQQGRIFVGVEEPGKQVQYPEAPGGNPAAPDPEPQDDDDHDLGAKTAVDDRDLDTTGVLAAVGFAQAQALPFSAHAGPAPPMLANPPPPRPQRMPGDPNETTIFVGPNARGGMPPWLDPSAASGASAPPAMASAPVVAPPPPVSQLLRTTEPVPPLPGFIVPPAAVPVPTPAILSGGRPPGTTIGQAAALAASTAHSAGSVAQPPPPPPVAGGSVRERRARKPDPRVLATAAFLGAAEASNAAATSSVDRPGARVAGPAEEAAQPASASVTSRAMIELLWFAPGVGGRLRAEPAWKKLCEGPEARESKDAPAAAEAEAADAPEQARKNAEDRAAEGSGGEGGKDEKQAVCACLARGRAALDVEAALAGAANEDGVFEAKLSMVTGELELPFDEVEMLKVLTSAATSLASGDKKLKETLDLAAEVQSTPLGQSPEVAQNFSLRVREAWAKANRMLPADYLDVHSRRVLLEQRRYQRRELAGKAWIRALLHLPSSDRPVPTYLPAELEKQLPLFPRFPVRLVVEVVPQQDASETHPVALRALAVARQFSARQR
jgi:hypothetical protein